MAHSRTVPYCDFAALNQTSRGIPDALLRSADKLSAKYSIIVGDDEIQSGIVILRNMETKEQQSIPLKDLSEKIMILFQ